MSGRDEQPTARCVTCGTGLHPERARKYDYYMARECQDKNAKGLTMVSVGMNKAADELLILDERTREELARGRYHDQRRGTFGAAEAPARRQQAGPVLSGGHTARTRRRRPDRRPPVRPAAAPPWTAAQERLALLYNEQGLRPAQIAQRLGVSSYLATQIILAAKNRGKT